MIFNTTNITNNYSEDHLVTIPMKEYSELLLIKKAMEDNSEVIIIDTYDEYIHCVAYTNEDAIAKIKDEIKDVLSEYISHFEFINEKLPDIKKIAWYKQIFKQ